MLSIFFKKFLILESSDSLVGWFVVMITPLLDKQMKSAMTSELEFFKCSLMLVIILCTDLVINSVLGFVIRMMTSFLDGPLVVIFNLGFFLSLLPFLTFKILSTSSADKDRKASFT